MWTGNKFLLFFCYVSAPLENTVIIHFVYILQVFEEKKDMDQHITQVHCGDTRFKCPFCRRVLNRTLFLQMFEDSSRPLNTH